MRKIILAALLIALAACKNQPTNRVMSNYSLSGTEIALARDRLKITDSMIALDGPKIDSDYSKLNKEIGTLIFFPANLEDRKGNSVARDIRFFYAKDSIVKIECINDTPTTFVYTLKGGAYSVSKSKNGKNETDENSALEFLALLDVVNRHFPAPPPKKP